jgi:hypothetical protein
VGILINVRLLGHIQTGVTSGETLTDINLEIAIDIVIAPSRNMPYTPYF